MKDVWYPLIKGLLEVCFIENNVQIVSNEHSILLEHRNGKSTDVHILMGCREPNMAHTVIQSECKENWGHDLVLFRAVCLITQKNVALPPSGHV